METAGLLSGFTDILSSQPLYKTTLTVNKATMIQGKSETTSADCWVTRSWDKDYNCTDCKPTLSIFRNSYFALMLTDQHGIAKVPSKDGVCVASCRLEGFTFSMLLDHALYMLTTAAIDKVEPRSNDPQGPVHALREAILLNKEVHIFISSGTSLILEGPAGYMYAMQRALDLTACKSFGVGKNNLFRRMVFIQPSINNTARPNNKSSMKEMLAH